MSVMKLRSNKLMIGGLLLVTTFLLTFAPGSSTAYSCTLHAGLGPNPNTCGDESLATAPERYAMDGYLFLGVLLVAIVIITLVRLSYKKQRRKGQNRKKRNRVRFYVLLVVGLLVIGLIGFLSWRNIVNQSHNQPPVYEKPSGWMTYVNENIPFKFDYPNSWEITREEFKPKNISKHTTRTPITVGLDASSKTDKSQTVTLGYSIGDPTFESGSASGCSMQHPSENCKLVTSGLTPGWLSVSKSGISWDGHRLDDGGEVYAHASPSTDRSMFETIIRSIRK